MDSTRPRNARFRLLRGRLLSDGQRHRRTGATPRIETARRRPTRRATGFDSGPTGGSAGVSARRSRGPERAGSNARERGPEATTTRWRQKSRPSVVVEALLDELLLDRSAV